mmetsp:Transcript_23617/g.59292  ORF Transcript_23617/g.59292 Transcript_23617/m.59292 type:complete len:183 (-) Transcript_23617:728-1276(-)
MEPIPQAGQVRSDCGRALLQLHKTATQPKTVFVYTYSNTGSEDLGPGQLGRWWRFEGVFSRLSKAKSCLRQHLHDYWDYPNQLKNDDELMEEAMASFAASLAASGERNPIVDPNEMVRHIEELASKKYQAFMAGEDGAEEDFDLDIDAEYTQTLNFGLGEQDGRYKCQEEWGGTSSLMKRTV